MEKREEGGKNKKAGAGSTASGWEGRQAGPVGFRCGGSGVDCCGFCEEPTSCSLQIQILDSRILSDVDCSLFHVLR